jgi:hypothetical protein
MVAAANRFLSKLRGATGSDWGCIDLTVATHAEVTRDLLLSRFKSEHAICVLAAITTREFKRRKGQQSPRGLNSKPGHQADASFDLNKDE